MKVLTSWRTSLSGGIPGFVLLLAQLSHMVDTDPATICDLEKVIGAISMIMLGLTARDNGVTSQTAGAK